MPTTASVHHTGRVAFAQFNGQVQQHVRALEECGSLFSQSSSADIPVSQLEHYQTNGAFHRLAYLPFQLHLTGDEPLSLTEARTLYNSDLLDTLCSILSRLSWKQLCNKLDDLIFVSGGFICACCALNCIHKLIEAWSRVKPSSNAETARRETFGRYYRVLQDESAYRLRWVRLGDCCVLPRFQSTLPVLRKVILEMASLAVAAAETGAETHTANLVLARATGTLQQARAVLVHHACCCTHTRAYLFTLLELLL